MTRTGYVTNPCRCGKSAMEREVQRVLRLLAQKPARPVRTTLPPALLDAIKKARKS